MQGMQGLQGVRRHEGAGAVLVAAALREHHRVTEAALGERDWGRAKSLYDQVSFGCASRVDR